MRCTRCHRALLSKPLFVNGLGYGPTCALKVQDQLPLRPARAQQQGTRRRLADQRQGSLLVEAVGAQP